MSGVSARLRGCSTTTPATDTSSPRRTPRRPSRRSRARTPRRVCGSVEPACSGTSASPPAIPVDSRRPVVRPRPRHGVRRVRGGGNVVPGHCPTGTVGGTSRGAYGASSTTITDRSRFLDPSPHTSVLVQSSVLLPDPRSIFRSSGCRVVTRTRPTPIESESETVTDCPSGYRDVRPDRRLRKEPDPVLCP